MSNKNFPLVFLKNTDYPQHDVPAILWIALSVLSAFVPQVYAQQNSAESTKDLGEVVVSGTREKTKLQDTAFSIGVVNGAEIKSNKPTHPSQVLSQVPGAAVAVTNGEGHTTAIRQPFTTSPVYQFLEDGIPTRSTGFFNHNGLYEINIPQAGGIEVIRGPGTALYGSDAIGGIVNVLTKTPPARREFEVGAEAGQFGWRRLLISGGNGGETSAWRADVNLTHTDGWRDKTAYDRQSTTARWDLQTSAHSTLKTIFSYSNIDQETGANSPLIRSDYESSPEKNYMPIAYRKVGALRLSTNYEQEIGKNGLLSITPYFRDNSMDLLASFNLSSDPTISNSFNQSYGLMAKYRHDFAAMRTRLIVGIDIDVSPGGREEDRILTTPIGSGASRQYLSYTKGARVYDYDVTFRGISPYIHAEFSPIETLRLNLGLRYDDLGYRYRNNLSGNVISATGPTNSSGGATRFYGQVANTNISFSNLSPKIGATFAIAKNTHLYTSINDSFRAPSESQIFRPSSSTNSTQALRSAQQTLDLKPIQARQKELGIRGKTAWFNYDLVYYDLEKRDDIISYTEADGSRRPVNAGKTSHKGFELGLGSELSKQLRLDVSYSHAKHLYKEWTVVNLSGTSTILNGKEIESAPRVLANARLTWKPIDSVRIQTEWVRIGSYWMNQTNTFKYEGHNLFNLRTNWQISRDVALFGSLNNLTNKRYADSASTSGTGVSETAVYSPGLPRTLTLGIEAKW